MALAVQLGVRQTVVTTMPRFLKRLTLAFAVLAVGLLVSGWIGLRVLATSLIDDTEPLRAQLVADWAKNANRLEADLTAVTAWNTAGEVTAPAMGCQLRWSGDSAALLKHLARCPHAPAPIDEKTLAALDALGDQLLVKAGDAPALERDLGWMAALQGHDDWSQVAGTPLEFFEVDPGAKSVMEAPALALRQVRGLALLRLLEGQRAEKLDAAVEDVVAFSRALLGRPFVLDQLVGIAVLDRTRAVLDGLGKKELGPDAATIQSLRRSRLASAFLWHPWVVKTQRDRFLARLPPASRCAAASELLLVLEVGSPLLENYPEFIQDLRAWRETSPCKSDFVNQALEARATMPAGSWRRLLRSSSFIVGAEQGELRAVVVTKAIESNRAARRAALEVGLSINLARPFPPEVEKP